MVPLAGSLFEGLNAPTGLRESFAANHLVPFYKGP
jgi:hypothetical protein